MKKRFLGIGAGGLALFAQCVPLAAHAGVCEARSGATINPVVELYTSEGCSSCPPADKWLSGFNQPPSNAVVMAFHVSYWDYIGWVDRFARPEYNQRQRDLARLARRSGVYTPQVVVNGADTPRWYSSTPSSLLSSAKTPAAISIALQTNRQGVVEADIAAKPQQRWSAFWTVTEDGHTSKVKAGENRGEQLRHDFVVRQYETVTTQTGNARIVFKPERPDTSLASHRQRVNLVVLDPESGATLQAVSAVCL